MGVLERWRELTPEQKEIALAGVHGTILGLIAYTFRKKGVMLRHAIANNPKLALAGVVGGAVYFKILSRILSKGHE